MCWALLQPLKGEQTEDKTSRGAALRKLALLEGGAPGAAGSVSVSAGRV